MTNPATMTWLGHSTIKLTLPDGRVILFDPWLKDNPACPANLKNVPHCDIIALSHGHSDHAGEVPALIAQHNPRIVATFELCAALALKAPKARFAPMNIGGTQCVDGIDFTLTRAFHSSSVDSESGPMYVGMPCGTVVKVKGLASFYHAGDTDVFSDMKLIAELHSPRIAALPIGDHFTMGPAGAALAVKFLNPSAIVPIHYGTFPLLTGTVEHLRSLLPAEFKNRLTAPDVGQEVTWTSEGLAL